MAVTAAQSERDRIIAANRDEYGSSYPLLTFPTAAEADTASRRRSKLLEALAGELHAACGGSKLFTGQLSPGCRICSEGRWSCLFINGRCNKSCFYCPGSQDETGLPTTNNLDFHSPADYAGYLEQFDFCGMSLSGGEPLLTPGRSLAFLRAAKNRFGDRLHTWLYSNGSLVTVDILKSLRDAGLNEIRFDIGAVGYSLEKPAMAAGIIPTVTIEIPAVPEEGERLKSLLPAMADAGVDHLNLHQLRLTPYNHRHFLERNYTCLHGEKVTILESELTALELMLHSIDRKLALPVNYCSFVYKNRYQKAAARSRGATLLARPYEELTQAGYLRTLLLSGEPVHLAGIAGGLAERQLPSDSWALTASGGQLYFSRELWSAIDFSGCRLTVSYASTPVLKGVSYRNPFKQLPLSSGRKIAVERSRIAEIALEGEAIRAFFLAIDSPEHAASGHPVYERPATGLQEYF